jgi:hypothetical protein
MEGSLRQHMFQGTIDEVRPMLAKEALASKLPAVLVNEKGDRFSLVFQGGETPCAERQMPVTAHYTTKPPGSGETYPLTSFGFCQAVP